jgi:Sec-independent protein translocase protein TatA
VFDISPEKLIVLLLMASVVLGPDRLSHAARSLARLRGDLRRLTSNLPPETLHAVRNPRRALIDVLTGPPDDDRPRREEPES